MDRVLRDKKAIAFFVLPGLLLFVFVVLIPMVVSLYYSLLSWDGIGDKTFIGLDNYIRLFTNTQDGFLQAVVNSLILALFSVFIQLPIALMLALVLARGVKGEGFYRTVYFIPVMLSSVVIGLLWQRIYHPTLGLLNTLLETIGLEGLTRTWLGDMDSALICVFIPIVWQWIGYHMLLMYASAKSIPEELREAALIDGATYGQIARKIMIPLMKPILRVCVVFAVVGSMMAFDMIFVLTGGGPAHATEVPSTLMINTIFHKYMYGYGSSMAVFIVVECLIFTLLIQRLMKTDDVTY